MKLRNFFILGIIAGLASCKPTYKATDQPRTTTDSVSTTTDNTSMPRDTTSGAVQSDTTSGTMERTSRDTSMSPDGTVPDSRENMSNNNTSPGSVNVPAGTQTIFTTQYPGATSVVWNHYDSLATYPIDWELSGWAPMNATDYTVQFNMNNDNYYAWYDSDGNWVGSTYVVADHSKLPAAVHTFIKNKYADYTISNVNTELQKDKTAYEIEMKKDNSKVKLLVSADGTIIKEKVKEK